MLRAQFSEVNRPRLPLSLRGMSCPRRCIVRPHHHSAARLQNPGYCLSYLWQILFEQARSGLTLRSGFETHDKEEMMPQGSLRELYIDELRDLYSAETQMVKALPKMAKAASHAQ